MASKPQRGFAKTPQNGKAATQAKGLRMQGESPAAFTGRTLGVGDGRLTVAGMSMKGKPVGRKSR